MFDVTVWFQCFASSIVFLQEVTYFNEYISLFRVFFFFEFAKENVKRQRNRKQETSQNALRGDCPTLGSVQGLVFAHFILSLTGLVARCGEKERRAVAVWDCLLAASVCVCVCVSFYSQLEGKLKEGFSFEYVVCVCSGHTAETAARWLGPAQSSTNVC